MKASILTAIVGLASILFDDKAIARAAEDPDSNPRSLARLFPGDALAPKPSSTAVDRLMQNYYDSIADWGKIVWPKVRPVPNHSNWRYLGLPGNLENDVRPTAYAAMVLSFLAEFKPLHADIALSERDKMRAEATGLLRYLTASHVTGGATCVNGKSWGNAWQSAMWARIVGMAAWQMWPHLDASLQDATIRLVIFEADRFLTTPPKSRKENDTGAEENGWNAAVLSLACNMLPEHPRAKHWEQAAKRYMYNSFSVAADANDQTLGDDGKPINQWVTTVNAHDDFTVENHGIVHVGYLKLTATELQENSLHWLLVGRTPPKAAQHHVPQVFQVLMNCMDWDGSPIYFAGNDWKSYQSQSSDVLLYCSLNLLTHDPRAAYLEETALRQSRKQQHAEGGYFNLRRDLEFSGFCASRMIMCCYAHAVANSNTTAIDAEQFDREASGVKLLPAAKTVVHRTPNKFASFSWAQKRMGLTLSRDGCSTVWPHFASYLGYINGEDTTSRATGLIGPKVEVSTNGFRVTGTISRCKDQVKQDFFFASPESDYTVYIERLRPAHGFDWKARETGVVGLEYPLDKNVQSLYGEFGVLETTGHGGQDAVIERTSNWLNIDNRIGYVACKKPNAANIIRFHDHAAGKGRVPHLQEWISLVGDEHSNGKDDQWACIVTFPNQTAQQTKAETSRVLFSVHSSCGTCRVGAHSITVDFDSLNADASKTANR
jgi:hypothetical protein